MCDRVVDARVFEDRLALNAMPINP